MNLKIKQLIDKLIQIKVILILSGFLLCATLLFSQESQRNQTVTLKNGNTIIAKDIKYTDDYILITNVKGERFQLNQIDIDTIKDFELANKTTSVNLEKRGNFGVLIAADGGLFKAPGTQLTNLISSDFEFALGATKLTNGIDFIGLGAGYTSAMHQVTSKSLAFVPVFMTGVMSFNEQSIAPFIGSTVGYAFHVKGNYAGGSFIKLKSGIKLSINPQTDLLIGLQAKIANISGTVIEQNEHGEFMGQGNRKLLSGGLSFSIIF